jgi:hypothetical protein
MSTALSEEEFYRLVNEVIKQMRAESALDRWIDGTETMQLLRITSKTTLQKLRNEGKIRFSQIGKKLILYDRVSILNYIESHAKNIF